MLSDFILDSPTTSSNLATPISNQILISYSKTVEATSAQSQLNILNSMIKYLTLIDVHQVTNLQRV